MEAPNDHIILQPQRKYLLKPIFGLLIAIVIMVGYLYSGELKMSDIASNPSSGKSLLFIGTVLIILIYGLSLLIQYNYVELVDGEIVRHFRFPKRQHRFDLKDIKHWVPVSIASGRVLVTREECTQLEIEFKNGGSIKLTADRYQEMPALLAFLRENYPGYFIDILADDGGIED